MRRLVVLSLHAALDAVRQESLRALRAEYPDERIEVEPWRHDRPHVYRCRVNGRPVGPPFALEDVVGEGMRRGREAAVRGLAGWLSQQVMLHLQTAE